MQRCRRRWALVPLSLIVAGIFLPGKSNADTRAVPELSLFVTHSNIFRSRFAANTTWSQNETEFTSGGVEYDLDVSLGSFFRRYIFKDPNAEKTKFLTIRLGYAYIADLLSEETEADERRGITEATLRLPIGNAWLLSDRNRVEFRHMLDTDSVRYRNRLKLERNVSIRGFRVTPYVNGEGFLDNQTDEWDQAEGTAGMEFPWRYSTIMELSFTWQFRRDLPDNQTLGVTLQRHL